MLKSHSRKRGRPHARYRCRDGTEVQGLSRLGDGRWKVSQTGQTFVEPDEHLAVVRFRAMTLAKQEMVQLPLTHGIGYDEARAATIAAGGRKCQAVIRRDELPEFSISIGSNEFWAAVRAFLLEQPKLVAQKTGVEQVGWMDQMVAPKESPKLASLGDLYAGKPGLSANEASRSRLFWIEFTKVVGVKTVRELTADLVIEYERRIMDAGYAPKSVQHRYAKVRTVLAHAIKRGKGIEDCRRALDLCAMLEVRAPRSLDPRPIAPDDFWAIHGAATQAGNKTFAGLMLTALNLAMYGSEAGALRWDEVDTAAGHVAARRHKTNIPRIGVLWPETLAMVRNLPRNRETIFNTRVRSYTQYSVVDAWSKYRAAAKVGDTIDFSHIRDAAYSTALTISLDQARLLAGHRLPGSSDHYVMRNPKMVANACQAIRLAFDVAGRIAQ